MLLAPRIAVVGLTPSHNKVVPSTPVAIAKISADLLLTSPLTKGLFRVLLIFASYSGSNSMFNVFADAIARNVPLVRKSKVKVLREGASVALTLSKSGTG